MKKFLALLLAVMMMLSLVACGGNETPSGNEDNPPSSGQQQEDKTPEADPVEDEPEDNSGEEVNAVAVDWPSADYISAEVEYTGAGTIIDHNETIMGGDTFTYVYVSGSSLEDVENYIAALKANGVEYYPVEYKEEPEVAFELGEYEWYGLAPDGHLMRLTVYEEAKESLAVEGQEYNLAIRLYKESKYLK